MSKRKHVAVTIAQELEIMRFESGEIEREVAVCIVRISVVCGKIKKQKDQV